MAVSTAVLKLNHGGATLNLMSGRYAADFVPPDSDVAFATSSGTIGNQLEGAGAVGWSAKNRSISFRVRVLGDSEREISRGIQDVRAFLNRGSESEPVRIEYKPNSDTPRPSWGQDGTRYYEVVTFGSIMLDPLFGTKVREKAARFVVTVTVKPYAHGLPQLACQAMGAINHVTIGAQDGRDKGIVVSYPSTNVINNPIHGHATWNTGWTASANMTSTENSDPAFVPAGYGVRSAKLQAKGASADWYQSPGLTVSTYTLSFYCKRPDGGVVDSTIVQIIFLNAARTSTYTDVGDGWYRVKYTGTGQVAVAAYGLRLTGIATILFVSGWQLENVGYATPVAHGDQFGCAWSSTIHNSSTTRVAPFLRLPIDDWFNAGAGCIRTVVTFPDTSAAYGSNPVLFYDNSSGFRAYYDTAGTWYFNDGTNSINGGSAISAGTSYVLHFVWDQGRLQIYLNGSSIASGATHTVQATYSYLYIGSDNTPALHQNQRFSDFTAWGQALTTAQVLADYTAIAPLVADGQRVSEIPYCWTEAGDGTIHVYDDNTYTNWGVIAGVPGTAPADTRYKITGNGGDTAYLGLWDTREFIRPTRILYQDNGGTANAGSSGGSYRRTTPAAATETDINTSTVLWVSDPKLYRFVADREWFAIVRARIASGTGKLRQRLQLSGTVYVDDIHSAPAPVTYFRQVLLPSIYFPRLNSDTFTYPNLAHYVTTTNSGAAVNTDFDFYCLFPRRMVSFAAGTTILRGHAWATEYEFPAASIYEAAGVTSESLDVFPETYNVMLGDPDGESYVGADSGGSGGLQILEVTISPRYALG